MAHRGAAVAIGVLVLVRTVTSLVGDSLTVAFDRSRTAAPPVRLITECSRVPAPTVATPSPVLVATG